MIGQYHHLRVLREVDFGFYLALEGATDILLPRRYAPDAQVDDQLAVFVYRDSEDRLIATTERPLAAVGECAFMEVMALESFGAFVDWGLSKELLVPYREQTSGMQVGRYYPVFVYLDERSQRLAGSCRLGRFIAPVAEGLTAGEMVSLLLISETDLGYKAVVNHRYWGLLYRNEVFREVLPGDRLRGYVRQVRDDGQLDLTLRRPGYSEVETAADEIRYQLAQRGGRLPLTDKSDPADIYETLNMSKKTFKQAVGKLYREQVVTLHENEIRLRQQ